MPNFESPIGNRKFNQQNFREFNVSDETEFSNQEFFNEEDISHFQNKVASYEHHQHQNDDLKSLKNKKNLTDGAKRRIEMLLGMTQMTRDVKIGENIFTLRLLKSKDMRAAIAKAAEFDGTIHASYEARRQFLSRSLTHISGIEIDDFLGSSTLESKLEFLDELDEPLLGKLFLEYNLLEKDAKQKLALNNKEDAAEVVENIKK